MNPFDILGAVMGSGMSPSAGNRMGNVFGQMMGSGHPGAVPPAGMAGMTPSDMAGRNVFEMLGKVAGAMLGGRQGGAPGMGGGLPLDILKQVAGSMLGGSAGSGNMAAGAGAMTVFGALAAQAIEVAKRMLSEGQVQSGAPSQIQMNDATAVMAGLRPPQTAQEQQALMDIATLTLKAMINAAKADGQIDQAEAGRLVGKLKEGGLTEEEQGFVMTEMQKPSDTDAIVRAVPNQQVAAQIYTASLMAIEVDTDAERRYLEELAGKLGLNQYTVGYLHQAVGLA
jgi:uncharacterized membrane protein YebE (DUF533 family)